MKYFCKKCEHVWHYKRWVFFIIWTGLSILFFGLLAYSMISSMVSIQNSSNIEVKYEDKKEEDFFKKMEENNRKKDSQEVWQYFIFMVIFSIFALISSRKKLCKECWSSDLVKESSEYVKRINSK